MGTDVLNEVERGAAELSAQYESHQAAVKRIEGDERLTPEARAADIARLRESSDSQLAGRRDELLAQLEALDVDLGKQEGKIKRSARPGPRDVVGWQEAQARAAFVESDVTEMVRRDPREVVTAFHNAIEDGDQVEAWLIWRAAQRLGDKEATIPVFSDLQIAASHAWPEDVKRLEPIAKKRARVSALSNGLRQVMTFQEKREFAARYRLDERYLS